MFKSEFQRKTTAVLENNFKTKIIQLTKEKSVGLQPELRDAGVFVL